jgi:D-alanine-D-alanine ligase-like ATP-grasp enzyme
MLLKIAPEIGAKILFEPNWNAVGRITFKSGTRRYFRYNNLDINSKASSEIAKDKDYSNFFLKSLGYPIIPNSKAFYSDNWADAIGSKDNRIEDACSHAKKIGFPVIVKPNSGCQGTNVNKIYNLKDLLCSLNTIFKNDRIAIVQNYIQGKDYRIVVLDNKIIAVYRRIPLNIVGNGKSTIKELFEEKINNLTKSGRTNKIRMDDYRIKLCLRQQKLKARSIPKINQIVFLLDNANLSTGGDTIDVSKIIHPYYSKIAIDITKNMGLRFCGIDIMTTKEIDIKSKYWIIEINSNPSLFNYITIGKEQREKIEKMYREILAKLDN